MKKLIKLVAAAVVLLIITIGASEKPTVHSQ